MLKFANTNSLIRIFLIDKPPVIHYLMDFSYVRDCLTKKHASFPDIPIYNKTGHCKNNGKHVSSLHLKVKKGHIEINITAKESEMK